MTDSAEKPATPPGPIVSLVYKVKGDNREKLLQFLKRAVPVYERPGGIKVALYESIEEPNFFIELVAYAGHSQFAEDQQRVDSDPEMKRLLEEWHELIDGSLKVHLMRKVEIDE